MKTGTANCEGRCRRRNTQKEHLEQRGRREASSGERVCGVGVFVFIFPDLLVPANPVWAPGPKEKMSPVCPPPVTSQR